MNSAERTIPDSELAVVSVDSFPAPTLIASAGPSTRKKFFEFFTVPIRNANTRAAYYRAIQQFLFWCERAGYRHLEDIEPITVAAYIETLQRQAAPPTVKQHMAAIRMLFSWLTEKGVLAMNPAREVKTERFSRTEGKTQAFVDGEVQKLLDAMETFTHTGLRDRALLGVLAYTFARIGAAVNLKVQDYYPSGKRFLLHFREKGGKETDPGTQSDRLIDRTAVWSAFKEVGVRGLAETNRLTHDQTKELFHTLALDRVIQLLLTSLAHLRTNS
jgi:Phage integrase, N-terminal SAM-like domain